MSKSGKLSSNTSERVSKYLSLFKKEDFLIRSELAAVLPFYNELLEMKALSFEEFALLPIAKKQGFNINDPLFSYDTILPPCKKCGSVKNVRKLEENSYFCRECNLKYSANHDSISSGTRCSSIIWLKVLHCMLDFYSMERTCKYCKISANTYYLIRNKIFYAMQLMMEEVKLYGNIQCDNTFVHISFRGTNLEDQDYPEDSLFFENDFKPRKARKRGGSYSHRDKNQNSACIFTAIDDSGHIITKFAGIGALTSTRLADAIGNNKILLKVPENDPFIFSKKNPKNFSPRSNDDSLLISDKESAIQKFAQNYGIQHECHVYRANGIQRKLPTFYHDIQRVNNLHHKLKDFLRNTHNVSSKYLPGFLVMFEFIENTGASPEAISKLFQILSQPKLGKSPTFYKELYTIPNYMQQWLSYDNPLKKFKHEQLLAYYLYKNRLLAKEQNSDLVMSVTEIAHQCGLSCASVRRNYKNFEANGYGSLIEDFFNNKEQFVFTKGKSFKPNILAMYDEYCINRQKSENKDTIKTFTEKANKKYQTNLTPKNLYRYFLQIQNSGIRPPMPPIEKAKHNQITGFDLKLLEYRKEFEFLKLEKLKNGENCKTNKDIIEKMANKHNVTYNTMYDYTHTKYYEVKKKLSTK